MRANQQSDTDFFYYSVPVLLDNEPDVEISIYLYLAPKFAGGENNYDYLTYTLFCIDTVEHQDGAISNPMLSNNDDVKKVRKIIERILTQWYSDLSELFSTSLQQIATDMFSHGIISQNVRTAPAFMEMMQEFQSGMKFIRDGQRLVNHCQIFLQILVKQGGPHKQAAISIAEDWIATIKRELDINIKFDTKY